jgi:hypothetical protein
MNANVVSRLDVYQIVLGKAKVHAQLLDPSELKLKPKTQP